MVLDGQEEGVKGRWLGGSSGKRGRVTQTGDSGTEEAGDEDQTPRRSDCSVSMFDDRFGSRRVEQKGTEELRTENRRSLS